MDSHVIQDAMEARCGFLWAVDSSLFEYYFKAESHSRLLDFYKKGSERAA